MTRKRFETRSAVNAQFFRCELPWAAIAISSDGDFPTLDETNRLALLRLIFEDTLDRDSPDSFSGAQATAILDFVAEWWDRIDVLLVHCELGLSRSPAVAAALSRIYYQDDGPWFEQEFPNALVYELLLETHAQRQRPGEAE